MTIEIKDLSEVPNAHAGYQAMAKFTGDQELTNELAGS